MGSVAKQLRIWEGEMNCIRDWQGMLIKFDNREQHREFREFKDANNIICLLWSNEWKEPPKENVAVVDISQKRAAYAFINDCKH